SSHSETDSIIAFLDPKEAVASRFSIVNATAPFSA
ncbi:MAG: hypothetical protein K0S41_4344, partial [Anaerocolumna sp.]|nr:hypothetical protein [Anaerocolumna sp.]